MAQGLRALVILLEDGVQSSGSERWCTAVCNSNTRGSDSLPSPGLWGYCMNQVHRYMCTGKHI